MIVDTGFDINNHVEWMQDVLAYISGGDGVFLQVCVKPGPG